jgi:hypothetical protein
MARSTPPERPTRLLNEGGDAALGCGRARLRGSSLNLDSRWAERNQWCETSEQGPRNVPARHVPVIRFPMHPDARVMSIAAQLRWHLNISAEKAANFWPEI